MRSPSPLAIWAGLIVLYVVWGSTYLAMKLAVDSIPPFLMGAFRFIPAGILLGIGIAVHARGSLRRPSLRETRDASIVGALLLVGATGLVGWSEQTIPTGIAAILIALVPMWLAIFGRVLFGDRIPGLAVVGIAIGLVGVAILAWPTGGVGALDPAGILALLVASVSWSLGTLFAARRAVMPVPALLASSIQMLAAGLGSLAVAAVTGELAGFELARVEPMSWFGIAYLVTIGSLVGYSTYAWLIRVAPLARVATYAYVNPVVAVILGALILSEPLTARTVVASVVIVVAVALIVTARGRAGRVPDPAPLPPPATWTASPATHAEGARIP